MADTFHCTLVTPESQLLDEEVAYASVPAWDGLMGVAPGRAAVVAKLGDGPLRLDFKQGGSRYFFVGGGFLQIQQNRLTLLTTQATPAEEIVAKQAEEELRAAQQRKAVGDEAIDQRITDTERARTKVHLARQERVDR